ncbi:putative carboxysome structural protein [Paenibacillus alvei TS-15]|uniref:Putative carboxysome structural protein n=1 Tax=Paenibacillus alvei TS-15 TaxID=1117108 RepID=S9SYE4_PAEAL|nr:BMC domain-containing protein [Paenibacillus alvei]EPY09118.1 putative carboxysome structural protein [Paenibacillus alvei TS-15]
MRNSALGLVEVRGYLGAVAAADAALKAASVTCIGVEIINGGLVTVKLDGDVGAVQAAVEAGAELAKQLDVLVTRHVIARMHEETAAMVATPDDEGDNHYQVQESDSTSQNGQGVAELVSEIAAEHEAVTDTKEAKDVANKFAATSINEADEKNSRSEKHDVSDGVSKSLKLESTEGNNNAAAATGQERIPAITDSVNAIQADEVPAVEDANDKEETVAKSEQVAAPKVSQAKAESTAAKASNSTVESKPNAGITKTAQAAVTASNTTSTVDNKQKQAGTGNGGAARVKPVPSPAAKRSKSTKKASS